VGEQSFSKSPDEVLPGDIVIPARGRYAGTRCEVTDVLRDQDSTYNLVLVPTTSYAVPSKRFPRWRDRWNVDYRERIAVVSEPEGEQ
jgi:hypothetical protein